MSWYRDFFDDDYLRVFERELGPERTEDDVEGIIELAGLRPGMRVLDLACGHGRHAIGLARGGLTVAGLDLSPVLVARARKAAARADVEVTWHEQDMRVPVGHGRFDAAVNLFNAFGYLEDEAEDRRALDAVAVALVDDGVFLQEFGNREAQIRDFRPADVHRFDDGLTLIEERELDLRRSRLHVRYQFLEADGTVSGSRSHALRLYSLTELVALHESAGLHVEAVFGGLDGDELDLDDPFVVLRSRKVA
jgi:SAM-dependent methyltransferase